MSTSGLAGGVICSLHACASESQIASASKSSMGVKSSLSQSPQMIVPPAPFEKAEMVLQMFLASLFLELFTSYVCVSLPMARASGRRCVPARWSSWDLFCLHQPHPPLLCLAWREYDPFHQAGEVVTLVEGYP